MVSARQLEPVSCTGLPKAVSVSVILFFCLNWRHVTELSPRRTSGDRDSRSWGKVQVIHHATRSPPGVGARYRLSVTLHCHHQELGQGTGYPSRYIVTTRSWGKVQVIHHATLSPPGVGARYRLSITLHCHHQNDSDIKTGSDVSHVSVSLNVRDKFTGVSTNHNI